MNTTYGYHQRLVFSSRAWMQLRPLLLDSSLTASGPMRVHVRGKDREWLMDALQIETGMPRGQAHGPLEDWSVVLVDHHQQWTPSSLLNQLEPRRSHRLAVIILRLTEELPCQIALWDQGEMRAIDELWVNGPGMLRIDRQEVAASDETQDQPARWSRTIGVVGPHLMSQLHRQTITQVGAGRLGSQTAFQFASLGVAALRLIDGDQLNWENLDAMLGLHLEDVGQQKAAALAKRLCAYRSDLAVSVVTQPVHAPAARSLLRHRADLLVSCVDNDSARLAVSLAAREQLTPHLDIASSIQHQADGTLAITADVRLLLPGEGCVACVGGVDDLDRCLYDLASPHPALQRGTRPNWQQQRAGSLITINGLAVSTGVQAWLDLCSGQHLTSSWHRLQWLGGTGLVVNQGPVAAADQCPFCRRNLPT